MNHLPLLESFISTVPSCTNSLT